MASSVNSETFESGYSRSWRPSGFFGWLVLHGTIVHQYEHEKTASAKAKSIFCLTVGLAVGLRYQFRPDDEFDMTGRNYNTAKPTEGENVGVSVVGVSTGEPDGSGVGSTVGFADGIAVCFAVGFTVGSFVVGAGFRFHEFVCGSINTVSRKHVESESVGGCHDLQLAHPSAGPSLEAELAVKLRVSLSPFSNSSISHSFALTFPVGGDVVGSSVVGSAVTGFNVGAWIRQDQLSDLLAHKSRSISDWPHSSSTYICLGTRRRLFRRYASPLVRNVDAGRVRLALVRVVIPVAPAHRTRVGRARIRPGLARSAELGRERLANPRHELAEVPGVAGGADRRAERVHRADHGGGGGGRVRLCRRWHRLA